MQHRALQRHITRIWRSIRCFAHIELSCRSEYYHGTSGSPQVSPNNAPDCVVHFGVFELDLRTGELRKSGVRVKLQEQPFRILAMLLARPGEVVSRDELRNQLWAEETYVDFDHGLNTAVQRLRESLGDTAENPRFVQTLPRRGYRFLAPVNGDASRGIETSSLSATPEPGLALSSKRASETTGFTTITDLEISAISNVSRQRVIAWSAVALCAATALSVSVFLLGRRTAKSMAVPSYSAVDVQRLTDWTGIEESPAISPDGRSLAFVADQTGNRQIWVRLVAGGAPLQITHGTEDHLFPRWSHDAASLFYYVPPASTEAQGTLWEISALGGAPRPLCSSVSGADVSHDGKKLAFFRFNQDRVELVVTDRDGSNSRIVARLNSEFGYLYPRWSPDDRWLAYQTSIILADKLFVVPTAGGEPKELASEWMQLGGLAWLPDGSGILFSSARGSTVFYLPTMNLWIMKLKGDTKARKLTYGEASYEDPDVDRSGGIFASRMHRHFDLWKLPVGGTPPQNLRGAIQITHQTGQVQTPSAAPTDQEIAFLSDTGGHGNIWISKLKSGDTRQITFEKDPNVALGVPVWSPDGAEITFVSIPTDWEGGTYWLVKPDGSNLRRIVSDAAFATWSADSRWIYCNVGDSLNSKIMKIPVQGGAPKVVREENATGPAVASDGSGLYYLKTERSANGLLDYQVRVARPETGPSNLLAVIPGSRVPHWQGLHPVISHDGKWLALPLNDEFGTNIWVMSTEDGRLRRVVDFAPKRTFIARRLSWSSDDRYILAAIGEGDADIVLLNGLLPSASAGTAGRDAR